MRVTLVLMNCFVIPSLRYILRIECLHYSFCCYFDIASLIQISGENKQITLHFLHALHYNGILESLRSCRMC
jgi:hypothetical protein